MIPGKPVEHHQVMTDQELADLKDDYIRTLGFPGKPVEHHQVEVEE